GSVARQIVRERRTWRFAYLAMLVLAAMLTVAAWRRAPGWISVAAALLLLVLAAWVVRPLVALHLTVFVILVGDAVTAPWYPMAKNFSSRESILYVADRFTLSPIDLTLGFAMAWLLLRRIATRVPLVRGPLLRPLLVFTGFVVLGFVYGIARGGSSRVAVFEVRPLLYLPMVYVLASNLCRSAGQYRRLLWTAMGAVLCNSLLALSYYSGLSHARQTSLESLGEHGSAVGMNALFVLLIGTCLFRGCSVMSRCVLILMTLPVGWVYFLSNRRAAVIGLLAGLALLSVILFWRQPRTFWKIVPIVAVLVAAYVAAFWNSKSTAAFPAQAIKSVISPNSLSARDQSSDLYRQIENNDLNFTIRQTKVMGVGFGNPFYQPFPLPDISLNFEFHSYIPHNSVLWIWLQTGFSGFVAMMYLLGRALMVGASKIRRLGDGSDMMVVTTATIFIAMYAVFTYVDISWDARNMTLLGVALALCANFPVPAPRRASADSTAIDASTTDLRDHELVM
ncbi:MAG: O-antigen ligase family protein, partial [Ilumatobacteraceae bacterium]